MPTIIPFAASLVNTTSGLDDLTLSTDATLITIVDNSNYLLANHLGEQEAAFTIYRKLIVSDDNGNDYVFFSLTGGDELIDSGDSENNTFSYIPHAGDSLYKVRLISVPTWDGSADYSIGDSVVQTVNSVTTVYKLILPTSIGNSPSTNPSYWKVITDDTTLPVKYNTVGYLAVARTIQEAQIQAVLDAQAEFSSESFASPMGNKFWLKEAKLDMIIKSISINVSQGNWSKVSQLIAEGKEVAVEDCTVS